jgi:lipoate-protein ligase A
MALDEAIVDAVSNGVSPSTMRFYEWDPHAITLGYSQKIGVGINTRLCAIDGVDITRRLTGGRAVFHEHELAYSVIGTIDDPFFGGRIIETYKSINRVILDGFHTMGIDAEMNMNTVQKKLSTADHHMLPCFLTASRFEITVRTRKIVGSAQRRFGRVFLQQGSILTGPGQEKLIDYMAATEQTAWYRKEFVHETADVWQTLSCITAQNFKMSLYSAFCKALNCDSKWTVPSQEELDNAERLIIQRYNSKGWIFGDEKGSCI